MVFILSGQHLPNQSLDPQSQKHKLYAQRQESARKDVEQAFGVLQKRWAIIRQPARLWARQELVEDERGSYGIPDDNTYEQGQFSAQITGLDQGPIYGFAEVLQKNRDIRDRATHRRLKQDLIEHMWQRFGSQQQD